MAGKESNFFIVHPSIRGYTSRRVTRGAKYVPRHETDQIKLTASPVAQGVVVYDEHTLQPGDRVVTMAQGLDVFIQTHTGKVIYSGVARQETERSYDAIVQAYLMLEEIKASSSHSIIISGDKSQSEQAGQVIAALFLLSKRSGIKLRLRDIVCDIEKIMPPSSYFLNETSQIDAYIEENLSTHMSEEVFKQYIDDCSAALRHHTERRQHIVDPQTSLDEETDDVELQSLGELPDILKEQEKIVNTMREKLDNSSELPINTIDEMAAQLNIATEKLDDSKRLFINKVKDSNTLMQTNKTAIDKASKLFTAAFSSTIAVDGTESLLLVRRGGKDLGYNSRLVHNVADRRLTSGKEQPYRLTLQSHEPQEVYFAKVKLAPGAVIVTDCVHKSGGVTYLEKDHHGSVVEVEFDRARTEAERQDDAIKQAELYLMDYKPGSKLMLFRGADKTQAERLFAALLYLSNQSGIILSADDVATDLSIARPMSVDPRYSFYINSRLPHPARTSDVAVAAVSQLKQLQLEKIKIQSQVLNADDRIDITPPRNPRR